MNSLPKRVRVGLGPNPSSSPGLTIIKILCDVSSQIIYRYSMNKLPPVFPIAMLHREFAAADSSGQFQKRVADRGQSLPSRIFFSDKRYDRTKDRVR